MGMKLVTLIVGEFVLLFASVLVFRSTWLLLDEFLGIPTYGYFLELE
jgi:hypothetical protein